MQYLISKNHAGVEFTQIQLILSIDVNCKQNFYLNSIKSSKFLRPRSSHFVGCWHSLCYAQCICLEIYDPGVDGGIIIIIIILQFSDSESITLWNNRLQRNFAISHSSTVICCTWLRVHPEQRFIPIATQQCTIPLTQCLFSRPSCTVNTCRLFSRRPIRG